MQLGQRRQEKKNEEENQPRECPAPLHGAHTQRLLGAGKLQNGSPVGGVGDDVTWVMPSGLEARQAADTEQRGELEFALLSPTKFEYCSLPGLPLYASALPFTPSSGFRGAVQLGGRGAV